MSQQPELTTGVQVVTTPIEKHKPNFWATARKVAGVATLATTAGVILPNSALGAAKKPQPTYSGETPTAFISTVQHDLFTGTNFVTDGFSMSLPKTISALGDCEAGSRFGLLSSTSSSFEETPCDGTPATTASGTSHSVNHAVVNRLPGEMKKLGGILANSIPGDSEDFNQKVTQTAANAPGTPNEVVASIACPSPNSKTAPIAFQSFVLKANHSILPQFCKANGVQTETSTLNMGSAAVKRAMSTFQKDPLRSGQPGAGDIQAPNMYITCPGQTGLEGAGIVEPKPILKYNSNSQDVNVSFFPGVYAKYCDLVGQFTEQFDLKKGNKKIGKSVLHIDGLKEILEIQYGLSYKRDSVSIPDVRNLCKGKLPITLTITEKFRAKKSQQFQRIGPSAGSLRSATTRYNTDTSNICK